ncbi:hypothetical protein WCP94_000012 (plasmid) [Bilophila wadsworthia]
MNMRKEALPGTSSGDSAMAMAYVPERMDHWAGLPLVLGRGISRTM